LFQNAIKMMVKVRKSIVKMPINEKNIYEYYLKKKKLSLQFLIFAL